MEVEGKKIKNDLSVLLRLSGRSSSLYEPVRLTVKGETVKTSVPLNAGDRILIYSMQVEGKKIVIPSKDPIIGTFTSFSKGLYDKKKRSFTDNVKRIRYISAKNNQVYMKKVDSMILFRCKVSFDDLLNIVETLAKKNRIKFP
jgi:hypothetical protein